MDDTGEFGRVWGKINILLVKVWSPHGDQTITSPSKARRICRGFTSLDKMESKKEVVENHGVKSAKGKE